MSAASLEGRGGGRYSLRGDLDFETVPLLWARSREAFGAEPPIEIDLSGVTHAGSAGLALLLAWRRATLARGARLRFVGFAPQTEALIALSDLQRVLYAD
jgi:anti-anti-sigma factor